MTDRQRPTRRGGDKKEETESKQETTEDTTDVDDLDDLMDEIDSVLEENAEEFVKNYVQKGGE